MSEARARASPSLALLKYWGKLDARENTPATPSVAVTLGGLDTETSVRTGEPGGADEVRLDGRLEPPERTSGFFGAARRALGVDCPFLASSRNSFPTAAGLASSSSGFAALAAACAWAAGAEPPLRRLSELARRGSASAARSVYGGFVLLDRGARWAEQLHAPEHWPDLRILAVVTRSAAKEVSSRDAMESTRRSSPYYPAWVSSSRALLREALRAIDERDLERIGELARLSALRMHAAMLASRPPLRYWIPETLAVLEACAALREQGTGAWETMDAGPQVKILCLEGDRARVEAEVRSRVPAADIIVGRAGPGVERR